MIGKIGIVLTLESSRLDLKAQTELEIALKRRLKAIHQDN